MFTKNTSKKFFTLVLIALLSVIQHHSVDSKSIFEVLQFEGCPDYSSQANLDLNKMSGVWYSLATNIISDPPVSCSKVNISINSNGTLQMDASEIKSNGSDVRIIHALYDLDSSEPGELFMSFPVTDKSILGDSLRIVKAQSSVIFTDYENIAVFYTCYNTNNYYIPVANTIVDVVVRTRRFDSLTLFATAVAPLIRLGSDLNDLHFTFQGLSCNN